MILKLFLNQPEAWMKIQSFCPSLDEKIRFSRHGERDADTIFGLCALSYGLRRTRQQQQYVQYILSEF